MQRIGNQLTDPENTATWIKYSKKRCGKCMATCCQLPVEVKPGDLVRMGLMDGFEMGEDPKYIARKLKKERKIDHYHSKTNIFTLSRMANGDCIYLNQKTRRCTIYATRPDTCRNHPVIGPRPGFCAFRERKSQMLSRDTGK